MDPVSIRTATFQDGLNQLPGLAVLRPRRLQLVPTGPGQHLGVGMALGLIATSIPGRFDDPTRELRRLAAEDPDGLDRRVAELAVADWTPDTATLVFGRPRKGLVPTVFRQSATRLITLALPGSTPVDLVDGWSHLEHVPTPDDLRAHAWQFAGISAVPALFSALCLWLVVIEEGEPWGWLGVVFWLLLPALFFGLWVAEWRKVRSGDVALPIPTLQLWPTGVGDPPPVPDRPDPVPLPLVARGAIGGVVDVGVLALAALVALDLVGLAPAFPAVVFAVQVALVARFGGTPCQRLLGVTVRGADGGRPGVRAAAVRVLAIWAFWGSTMCLAFVPLLAAVWHNGRHGVLPWDRLAGTRLAWSS